MVLLLSTSSHWKYFASPLSPLPLGAIINYAWGDRTSCLVRILFFSGSSDGVAWDILIFFIIFFLIHKCKNSCLTLPSNPHHLRFLLPWCLSKQSKTTSRIAKESWWSLFQRKKILYWGVSCAQKEENNVRIHLRVARPQFDSLQRWACFLQGGSRLPEDNVLSLP